jgi:hypothetical protein
MVKKWQFLKLSVLTVQNDKIPRLRVYVIFWLFSEI